MTAILDGQTRTGRSLQAFYGQREILEQAARLGVAIPPTTDVATDAPPALAFINPLDHEAIARWIVRCPDCPGGSAYVWVAGPHLMWCLACANARIGCLWRLVVVPPERLEIERLLCLRPQAHQRVWEPGESLDQLRAENTSLGLGV